MRAAAAQRFKFDWDSRSFKATELTLTIAVDPTELGVRIAIIAAQRYP